MIVRDLTRIKVCAFDVDGVLSRITVALDDNGIPRRTANIRDGYAIQHAMKSGLAIAVITGARVEGIRTRYLLMGVEDIWLGAGDKMEAFKELCQRHGIQPDEVLYMGDDIPDYKVMTSCGVPCCPADAAPEIKAISAYISPFKGGEGCVRDVVEQVLKAQGKWMNDDTAFGW